MKILKDIKRSLGDKIFYKKVIEGKFSDALRYYGKLCLVFILVSVIFSAIFRAPEASRFIKIISGEVLNVYPEDLEVDFIKGKAFVNKEEPVLLPLTDSMLTHMTDEEKARVTSLVVIDTKTTITPEVFYAYKTFILISKDYLVHFDNRGGIVFKAISGFPDFKITKDSLTKILTYGKYLPVLLVFGFAFGTFFAFLFNLVVILLVALVFMSLSKIFKQHFTYKQSLSVILFASTLPLILEALTFELIPRIPFLFSFLTLLIAVIVTKGYEHDTTEVVPHN